MIEKICLYLVKPSKYDDDGYVIRHWKGVLPSNTLACLYGLARDIEARQALGKHLQWDIEAIDETVQKVPVSRILRQSRKDRTKTIICLVGVQSNQFPRASDLALEFRRAGLDVLIGGFHVAGISATVPGLTPEVRELQDAGVTMVSGEVEGRLESILRDALNGDLKPNYNYLSQPADLGDAPLPEIPVNLLDRYAVRNFATLDCSRGCPFSCGFCTVINVHGRHMRFRPVAAIEKRVRENFRRLGITRYFFTDDNFCRNQNWEDIFDAFIRLRKEDNIPLTFMMQADVQSYLIPRFVEKAGLAGCTQVFIGMESLNLENLKTAGKVQNVTANFQQLTKAYRDADILPHIAYIIGFPFDSETSVCEDISRLLELGAEQASFFMLTPLPGSSDYKEALAQGLMVDADLNNFDSFHETFAHPKLKSHSWSTAYDNAWKSFYSPANMKDILKKTTPQRYWSLFLNYFWYKSAFQVEGGHPMTHGFFRRKSRGERRKSYPRESLWFFLKRRTGDLCRTFLGWFKLLLEMEEVWLATRPRSALEKQVIQELARHQRRFSDWRNLRSRDLQAFYRKAAVRLEHSSQRKRPASMSPVPSRLHLWFKKWNFFSDSLTSTRRSLDYFWVSSVRHLRQGRIGKVHPFQVSFMGLRECALFLHFLFTLANKSF